MGGGNGGDMLRVIEMGGEVGTMEGYAVGEVDWKCC